MDKILYLTLLLDFYGELLTEKQQNVFELYYLQDLSLNEIGELYGVTPQGVRDITRRTERILSHYEEKLELVKKHLEQERKSEEALVLLKELEGYMLPDSEEKKILLKIREFFNEGQ